MNIKEYVYDKTIKLDIVTVKFELILWDKKGEKLYTEVGLVRILCRPSNKSNRNNDGPSNC